MVPVVAVGNSLNALGVVRSLGGSGIPVFAASDTPFCAVRLSRFATFVRVPSLRDRPLVEGLKAVARQIDRRAVLILSTDRQVTAVSAAREELEPFYTLALPCGETVEALNDKAKFEMYARRMSFPVPRTVILERGSDCRQLGELSMPVVLKFADKTLIPEDPVERPVRAETVEQATDIAGKMFARVPVVIAQEWIEGEDDDIYFTLFVCDSESRIRGIFPGRKITCEPPRVGITAICVAATEQHEELEDLTRQFVEQVRYVGIGGLEFKRDRRTGRFLIVEPTVGRTDWQEEIATLCGINIPLIAYWTALGESGTTHTPSDVSVAWRMSASYRCPPGALANGTPIVDGYFRWSDPLPGIYHYVVSAFLRRGIRFGRRLTERGWQFATR